MAVTFENLIAHNKRVSTVLVAVLVLCTALLLGLIFHLLSDAPDQFDPTLFFTGVMCGALLAVLGAAGAYFFGGSIVAMISGARQIYHHDDPVLFNVVEEMAIAAGIPPPKIYAIPDDSPNAFATGRDPQHAIIGITTGLRRKLSRDELQAVIAHEIAHIKNLDIRLMMLVAVLAGIIVLVSDFFMRSIINDLPFRGRRRGASRPARHSRHGGGFALLAVAVSILLAWIAPVIAKLLQLAVSREREYLADGTAVQLCRNPGALVSALKKIALDPEPLECDNRATEHMFIINPDPARRLTRPDLDSIWSTHPPLIKRIQRISALAGLDARE